MAEKETAKPVKSNTIMGRNLSSHERPPRSGVMAIETHPICGASRVPSTMDMLGARDAKAYDAYASQVILREGNLYASL